MSIPYVGHRFGLGNEDVGAALPCAFVQLQKKTKSQTLVFDFASFEL